MDKFSDFKVFPYKDHYILCNMKGDKECHTHISKRDTCYVLIRLICNKRIPKSEYLRESVVKISRNEKYVQEVMSYECH